MIWIKKRILSVEFWVVITLLGGYLIYLLNFNVVPSDFYLNMGSFKKNPEFVFKKDPLRSMICVKSLDKLAFNKFYQDPELLFENTSYLFPSRFPNKKIAVVSIQGAPFIVQKFELKGFWDIIFSFLGKASNGSRAWFYGHLLIRHKIPTPKPLMIIEKKIGPFCFNSYLLTSYISGIPSNDYFLNNSAYQEHWKEGSLNVLKTISKLDNLKLYHDNYKVYNCLFVDDTPYLVDLERLHRSYLPKKNILQAYLNFVEQKLESRYPQAHKIFSEEALKFKP